jgi:hypothetical protein
VKTSKVLSLLSILFMLLLPACGHADSPQTTEIQHEQPATASTVITCKSTFTIHVVKHVRTIGFSYTIPVTYEWRYENDSWFAHRLDVENWQDLQNKVNKQIDNFNEEMLTTFSTGGLIPIPLHNHIPDIQEVFSQSGPTPSCDKDNINLLEPYNETVENVGYKTSLQIGTEDYLTVTTPGGSGINYTFPASLFDTITAHAFGDGDALKLDEPKFVFPITETTTLESINRTLGSMVQASQNQRPVIEFTLAANDLEGQKEVRLLLAKALGVLGSQMQGPLIATLHATLKDNRTVITFVQAGLKSAGMTTKTWWQQKAGTYPAQFDPDFSSTADDIVHGAIYLYPQAR